MNKAISLMFLVSIIATAPRMFAEQTGQAGDSQPNIIFILADDLGWMDTSVNGSGYYETEEGGIPPPVDKLRDYG